MKRCRGFFLPCSLVAFRTHEQKSDLTTLQQLLYNDLNRSGRLIAQLI